jgi:hypothetical protein
MKGRNNIYSVLIFSLLLISCNQREIELEKINESLQARIAYLENRVKLIEYSPIVIPRNRIVRIGESFIAEVRLSLIDKESPPIVIIYDFDESNYEFLSPLDTLVYNSEYHTSIIEINPNKTGVHKVFGKVHYSMEEGVFNEYGFGFEFEVTK